MDAADLIDADGTEDESGAPPDQQVEQNWSRPKVFEYKSYTSEFDEIVFADELCEGEELDRLRGVVDQHLQNSQIIISKLANRCLLYTSPSPRDATLSRMPSSA